jgi:hypothetical protein
MLLQEIRARQAMAELGEDNYTLQIHHSTPITKINNVKYSLVFPKSLLKFNDKVTKNIDKLFIGLITEKRKPFLSNFPDATIISSNRGRDINTKQFDTKYFKNMACSKFTLCPNGDFTWTYRFFEAIIFKSIPIIEDHTHHYNGYHYYTKNDKFIYNNIWVDENLHKLKKEMML